MDLLRSAYGSDDSDGEPPAAAAADAAPASPSKRKRGGGKAAAASPAAAAPAPPMPVPVQLVSRTVNSAPFVNPALKTALNRPGFIPPTQRELTTNVKAATLLAPLQGPQHPHNREMDVMGGTKLATGGYKEEAVMEKWNFHDQFHTFHSQGYARAETGGGSGVIGSVPSFYAKEGPSSGAAEAASAAERRRELKRKAKEEEADVGDEDDGGPWAPQKEDRVVTELEAGTLTEEQKRFRREVAERRAAKNREYNEEEDHDRRDERKVAHLLPPRHDRDTKAAEATSTFHGKSETDYQGRSWVEPPPGSKEGDLEHLCYLPKKCVHRYTGHTKGVQAIEFFPKYGHLLLSGSLDGKCKIWDVYNERQVKRTYAGHSAAVRCLNFNEDGTRFVTGGFDRFLRVWDTETGQVVQTVTNRKVPYCVRFYPLDNNLFITGMSDNRLYTFDTKSGEMVQEYNHHLSAVNTVTFYDDGRRFASTSDDKKMLLWEWDIPVPIKYVAEPGMHSMPAVTASPDGGFLACQSLDNVIKVFGTRDRFKELRKKVFRGHTNAGFACQMAFSPNSRFLASGDGEGKLHFWDWRTTRALAKYRAHDNGPCIGVQWHPVEPGIVATCGWDGLVKLWDGN